MNLSALKSFYASLNIAWIYLCAILFGAFCGYISLSYPDNHFAASMVNLADFTATIFINVLKLVSLPIIFLSIVSTASGMDSFEDVKCLARSIAKYTFLTTILAAALALLLFVFIDPVKAVSTFPVNTQESEFIAEVSQQSYLTFFLKIFPANFVQPFLENNVIGVLIIAVLLSLAIISIDNQYRQGLHQIFLGLYKAVIKIVTWVVATMPIALWAFSVQFVQEFKDMPQVKTIMLYLLCIILANLIQAIVILPVMLKLKKIPVIKTFKAMLPALSVAFFAKSSAAALPTAICCATEKVGVSSKTANFSFPLCTTINMNGCAAFILITVLFVSMSEGLVYTTFEMLLWILIATIAAIGNAGVPMGCYFLASAFLASMDIPLTLLGIILPFYSIIDMLESSINVWSDACVTVMVDQEQRSVLG